MPTQTEIWWQIHHEGDGRGGSHPDFVELMPFHAHARRGFALPRRGDTIIGPDDYGEYIVKDVMHEFAGGFGFRARKITIVLVRHLPIPPTHVQPYAGTEHGEFT